MLRSQWSKLFASAVVTLCSAGTVLSATPSRMFLGEVVEANHAMLGGGSAFAGSSVFDADTIATGPGGVFRFSLGTSQVYLRPATEAVVRGNADDCSDELTHGAVVVSSGVARNLRILIDGAVVKSANPRPAVIEATWVTATEFLLTSSRGEIEVALNGETRTVEAGLTYRVRIEPDDSEPRDTPSDPNSSNPASPVPNPNPTANSGNNRLSIIAMGAAAVAAGVAILLVELSPSKI